MPTNRELPDLYPSRKAPTPSITERLDPVVYGAASETHGPLAPEQLHFFDSNGFLFVESFLSPPEVDRYAQGLEQARAEAEGSTDNKVITEPDSGAVRSIFYVHRDSPDFSKLARDSRLLSVAEQILGSRVYCHQSRINFKPAFDGREFYWHSDFETWHVEDGMPRLRTLSCSIGLTENNQFNGPLMVIPGSHRRYVACVGETPDDHYKQSLKRQEYGTPDNESLTKLVDWGRGIEAPTGPAGSVLFFDCNTMHGSAGNLSSWPRSNVFIVYNSVENALVEPFSGKTPRPEFLGSRDFTPLEPISEDKSY